MTTLIINRELGLISSDSRATTTETETTINFKNFFPKRCVKEIDHYFDDTVKIFKQDKTAICGCGSLDLLCEIRDMLLSGKGYGIPDNFYIKNKDDLSNTNVYITKRTLGKVHTLQLKLTAKKLWWSSRKQKVKVEKVIQTTKYTADGSGWQFAAGSLKSGATDKEAIEAAIHFDDFSGGKVQQVWL